MSIKGFLWRVLLWLPVCFAAWYYAGLVLVLPVTLLVNLGLPLLLPGVVEAVEQHGHLLDVVTGITLAEAGLRAPHGQADGLVVFTVNPLIYGYGLPLFAGLCLAAPGEYKGNRIALAFLLLVPVQVYGVGAEVFKTLVFGLSPDVALRLGIGQWGREAVALAYQFGYLILPAVAPVVLWLVMHRGFVAELVPNLSDAEARSDRDA